jgi:hypothetical protein
MPLSGATRVSEDGGAELICIVMSSYLFNPFLDGVRRRSSTIMITALPSSTVIPRLVPSSV